MHVGIRGHVVELIVSSTCMWVPGIELMSPGLYGKCLYLLSHLTGLNA